MELEKRGLPAVFLADEGFVRPAHAQARMLGVPELPVLSLGAHTTTLAREAMRARVDEVIESIVDALIRAK